MGQLSPIIKSILSADFPILSRFEFKLLIISLEVCRTASAPSCIEFGIQDKRQEACDFSPVDQIRKKA